MGKKGKGKKGKGKGKGGSKGKKEQKVVDGLLPSEMARPGLLGFIQRLQAEVEKEREERNYYMLERQKIFQMWNLLMEQIALQKDKAALFDAHLGEVEKMKEGEDEVYNSKLRYLKQEQSRKIGQVRIYHLSMMKHIQDDNWAVQLVMREALMGRRKEMRQAEMAFFQIIRGLYWKHAKDISDLRKEFAREIRRLETEFDRRLFEGEDKKDEEQAKQVSILASNKELQIQTLVSSHHAAVEQLSKYFRDLITHNLGVICRMKESAQTGKTLELRSKRTYDAVKIKYEELVSAPVQWKHDMERWEVEHVHDDVREIASQLREVNEEFKDLEYTQRMVECSNEALIQRINIVEKEKDCLQKKYVQTIVDLQKQNSMNRFVHEIKKKGARREAELYEALAEDVEKVGGDDTNYFESQLSAREKDLANIKSDITEFATEHQNVEENYKEIFIKHEIHLADIGYPIKKTGAKAREREEDLFNASESDRASRSMSKKKRSTKNLKNSKKSLRGKKSGRSIARSVAPGKSRSAL